MSHCIKLKTSEDSNIFVWGCLHAFHKQPFVWQKRGYSSFEEHTESLLEKINNTCRPNDILFLLGDGFLNSEPSQVKDYLNKVKCKISYIFGNHESSVKRIYKEEVFNQFCRTDINVFPLNWNNVTFYGDYLETLIDKKLVVFSHFPLKVWNNSKFGAYHLHSHNHGGLPSSLPSCKEGYILDCGVDVFPDGPVPFSKIIEVMNTKTQVTFDSHH